MTVARTPPSCDDDDDDDDTATTSLPPAPHIQETVVMDLDKWFQERCWAVSGNLLVAKAHYQAKNALKNDINYSSTCARHIYFPKTTEEVAQHLVKTSKNPNDIVPVAIVCGGHEASNASLVVTAASAADSNAIVLDLNQMKQISLNNNDDGTATEITIQAGVVFQELVEFVSHHHGALPVGTGPTVGVVGYVVNGGLSGYFSKRLGLLGQRVTKFTIVMADGEICHNVTRQSNPSLFLSVLGAGSALGVVTEMTFTMADESILQSAEQFVATFETHDMGISFSRHVLDVLCNEILTKDSVSMELVYTASKAVIVTCVFYDTFVGDTCHYGKVLKEKAQDMGLTIVSESSWTTWVQVASALWPVINETSGTPLAMLQHSIGIAKTTKPSNEILDFLANVWIGQGPLVDNTIVEVRSLGGATERLPPIPSGNVNHPLFADMIVLFDAQTKSSEEIQGIVQACHDVLEKARDEEELRVDVSGTHSQADDTYGSVVPEVIFGSHEFAEMIQTTKQCVDPNNRFRFHPFTKILPSNS